MLLRLLRTYLFRYRKWLVLVSDGTDTVSDATFEDAINRVYEREAGGGELESDDAQVDEHEVAGGDILDSDDEAPVIRWVNSLFLQAMKERASDIHIEPEEKEVIVRYRIDVELYVARRAPRAFMSSIVSRIKIESSLNIAEKRLPQDGRIAKKIAGKSFDIRVSTIPTSRGYGNVCSSEIRLVMIARSSALGACFRYARRKRTASVRLPSWALARPRPR